MKMKMLCLVSMLISNCQSPESKVTYSDSIFFSGVACGKINSRLREVSGIIASINNPGLLWAINDSGNSPDIFLISSEAEIKGVWRLKDCSNIDWEDITIGVDSITGKASLYIGDIGDNFANRETIIVYKLEEPLLDRQHLENIQVQRLIFKLNDGKRDLEAMMYDPLSGGLFFVSKREDSVGLYSVPLSGVKDTLIAMKIASLPFTSIVAAVISPSGTHVILKNYETIFYWNRSPGQSIPEVLGQSPIRLPYQAEIQGEAVCFAHDESGYFTLSESSYVSRAKLFFYKKK